MAQTFNLPAVSDTMVEGEIIEWFVTVGETVSIDQTICSIETDKSVVDMTSPFAGTVLALGADPGDVLEVGQPLIVIGDEGEQVTAPTMPGVRRPAAVLAAIPAPTAEGSPSDADGNVRSPLVRRRADELGVDLATVVGSGHGGQITRADVEASVTSPQATLTASVGTPIRSGPTKAMPKVRRAAREANIDLAGVPGTGPNGVVTIPDLTAPTAQGRERRERLSALRRSIGAHLTESAATIPQFTSMVDVDATALSTTRATLRDRLDIPVPIDAVIMYSLIPVLRDHPRMNAQLEGDEIVYFEHFDIGVAVDTPDGLIVPVVTGAENRSVADIATEIVRLAEAARNRSIQPHEVSGATCTLNNVGAVGLEAGTPILPVGTTAIIAPGRIRSAVQIKNKKPVEFLMMTVSATFDHRVVDGGDAGRFLTQLREHLEVPVLELL